MLQTPLRFAGDLKRVATVVGIFAKYGLAGWLSELELGSIGNSLKSEQGTLLTELSFEERVRLALTDLGTTFIKLGQTLSTRPHLVGEALAAELSKLQQSTPPDSPEVAMLAVESELGRPVAQCFAEFEVVALASGSIAQAHRAILHSGKKAIVKVQHPGIEGDVRRDLDILAMLAELAEKNEYLRRYQPASLIREFSRTTLGELDFRRELRNLKTFRHNFADDQSVGFPKPYAELTGGRVLTMTRLEGSTLSDIAGLDRLGIDREQFARQGADVFVKMIFRDGFYHADPHPGNLLVMPNGKVGIIDAGMVGRVDEEFRHGLEDMLLAIATHDAQRLSDAITQLCAAPPDLDRKALGISLTEFLEDYAGEEIGQMNISGALGDISNIIHEHRLIMPGKLSMLIRCIVVLEGTGRLLNPSFNLMELLKPWQGKIIRERLSPVAQLKQFRKLYADWQKVAETAPRIVTGMLNRLDNGTFIVRIEHRFLKTSVSRLVIGLFMSALLLASTILIVNSATPIRWELVVLGFGGYVLSLLFGLRLLWGSRPGQRDKDH